jgi:hypothetical protein
MTILVAVLALGLPMRALADTYQFVAIPSAEADQIKGFVSQGVVLISENAIGQDVTVNLYTGQETVYSYSTAPSLEPLQGVCPALPAGFDNSNAQGSYGCDNGYILFASRYNTNGHTDGLYAGTVSDLTLLPTGGTFDGGGIDAVGDIAWTDGRDDVNYAAIDLTTLGATPEPASLPLVATGLLALAAAIRRRPMRLPS